MLASRDRLLVIDSLGRLVATLGRRGAGPLEFSSIRSVTADGHDTIVVIDAGGLFRRTTISPQLSLVRTSPLPPGRLGDSKILPSGNILLNAVIGSPDRVGQPLHELAAGSEAIVRSFGRLKGEPFDAEAAYAGERVFCAMRDGSIWASSRTRYVLEHWSPSRGLMQSLSRGDAIFRPYQRAENLGPSTSPPARVEALHCLPNNRVWVAISLPNLDWQVHIKKVGEGPLGPLYAPTGAWSKIMRTRIELIDLASASVLAVGEVPMFVARFLDDSRVIGLKADAESDEELEVWIVRYRP